MPLFTSTDDKIWVGNHKSFGTIVFDPFDQQETSENQVRLFIVHQKISQTFDKNIVRKAIKPMKNEVEIIHATAIYLQYKNTTNDLGLLPVDKKKNSIEQEDSDNKPAILVLHDSNKTESMTQNDHNRLCVKCGLPIAAERLSALPEAVTCLKCQTFREQTGDFTPIARDSGETWFSREEHWRNKRQRKRKK